MVTVIFELFTIGILLAFLGQYYKNTYIMTLSSLWYVLIAMTPFRLDYSVYGLPDYAVVIFYAAMAAILAVNVWFYYNRNKHERSSWD